jgi:hypothetical protein
MPNEEPKQKLEFLRWEAWVFGISLALLVVPSIASISEAASNALNVVAGICGLVGALGFGTVIFRAARRTGRSRRSSLWRSVLSALKELFFG